MNKVAEEILSYFGVHDDPEKLEHYGVKRRSGRYPWGSGDNPYQHSNDFISRIEELQKKGMTEKEIAAAIVPNGMSTTELRAYKSVAKDDRRRLKRDHALSMLSDGYSQAEVARQLGINESSLRSLLNEKSAERMEASRATADILAKTLKERGKFIDVGEGVERELGVSKEKLNEALIILEAEGYQVYNRGRGQVTNKGQQTNLRLLCPPGTEWKDTYDDSMVTSFRDYISYDGGESFRKGFEYPSSLNSKRLAIRYAEEGGADRDGLVELRRGCKDLDLGDANYAQVRIMVDGTHYIKGMAVYSDDLPDGVDVRFNTNKHQGTPKMDTLKPIKDDPTNPFGSLIKDVEHGGQYYYDDPKGKFTDPLTGKKQSLGLINKRAEEGDWGGDNGWKDSLASQFLSKQSKKLMKQQLDITYKDSEDEFNEIMSLTNPTVKKALLTEFADDCDGKAVHLKAAALPRQKYQVIIPNPDVKDGEIYAPNYIDGETVALIRYPHGGTFEIPICKVNNKNASARKMITENAADAVVINSRTASILSGADFDGDTVMVIPCNSSYSSTKINSKPPFEGLKDFDTKQYKLKPGSKTKVWEKGSDTEQRQMGEISNLITDMTLKGATDGEIERAVRHSMVIIDTGKHKLDWKQSYIDNGIAELKDKWQGHINPETGSYSTGSSTLISRAKSPIDVPKRTGSPKTNLKDKPWYDPSKPEGAIVYASPKTNKKGEPWYDPSKPEGSKVYATPEQTKEWYTDKKGKLAYRTTKSTPMAETSDARTLSSGTYQEEIYADYANKQKSLANRARLAAVNVGKTPYSASAYSTYRPEVDHLMAQVNVAAMNAPRERQAQNLATQTVKLKKQANPDMTKSEEKKISQIALTEARLKVGAKRSPVTISEREWDAIQAGALSENRLTQVLRYADKETVRKLAMPKTQKGLSDAKINKINRMKEMGYTNEQIGKAVGISPSSVSYYINK